MYLLNDWTSTWFPVSSNIIQTLLGATFASIFPDRVGRVILDGVVDADLYVSPVWVDSIRDADNIISSFYSYCLKAGEQCALYRKGDGEKDIETRFQSVLTGLKESPITVIDPQTSSPAIIHYDYIKTLLFGAAYSPTMSFPLVAVFMDVLYRRNEEAIRQTIRVPSLAPQACGPAMPVWMYPGDAQAAIMCSDKRYPVSRLSITTKLRDLLTRRSSMQVFKHSKEFSKPSPRAHLLPMYG